MKSKVFAAFIITALMITMISNAVLAAEVSRSASKVRISTACAEADGSNSVKFTVTLRDSNGAVVNDKKVYAASSRGTERFYAADGETSLVESGQEGVYETAVSVDGKTEFRVKSSETGTVRIGVGIVEPAGTSTSIAQYLAGNSRAKAETVGLIDVIEINFTKPDVKEVAVYEAPFPSEGTISGSGTKSNPYSSNKVKGDGIEYYDLAFIVYGNNNTPISDEKIVFSTNYPQVSLDKTSELTDESGTAYVRVYAKEGGKYSIKATSADISSEEIFFSFAASEPVKMVMSSMKIDALVPTGTDKADSQYFKLYDSNDNLVRPETLLIQNVLSLEWVTQPAGSNLEDDWAFDMLNGGKLMTNQNSANQHMYYTSSGFVVVQLPKIEKKGDYVLRINLKNHESVEIPFKGGDFGKVTKLTLKYDANVLPLDSLSLQPKVYRYNEEGLGLLVDSGLFGSEIIFAVSDTEKLAAGKSDINLVKGQIHTTEDADKKGKITITAVDTVNNLTAAYDLEVKDFLSDIKFTGLESNLPVNKKTTPSIKLLDLKGEEVYPGDLKTAGLRHAVTQKPEGSQVYIKEDDDIRTSLEDYGYAKFDIFCDKPGEVTFAVVLELDKYKNDGVSWDRLTFIKEKTVRFVSEEMQGAKKVVMFIGSTSYFADGKAKVMDAAPVILENRTYLPLRAVAAELNAKTQWDSDTRTITLAREDRTVSVTIGSSLVKVSNSPAFMADGVPLIKDGRAYVPFRVIGEAFGSKVNPVLDDNDNVIGIEFSQEETKSSGMMGR